MRFFTSDAHFSHEKILKYASRPWHTVEQMNSELIRLWNDTVTDEDDVFILGDLLMGKLSESLELVHRLNGKNLFLVPGNHDRVWQGHGGATAEAAHGRYEDAGLIILPSEYLLELGGKPVKLCHFPYEVGIYDTRYEQYHPKIEGDWLLHGHVHSAWRVRGKQINVGVDVWSYRPVSEEWLIPIINRIP